VAVDRASAEQLENVHVLVEGLDPDERYDITVSDPQGHSQTYRKAIPNPDGTYPLVVVVDATGLFTIDVFPIVAPAASASFRGV